MTEEIILPHVGHTFIVDFGIAVFHTTFDSAHQLAFYEVHPGAIVKVLAAI